MSIYRAIRKSLRDLRSPRYSSRDGHAEGEHVNRGRDTPSFCPTLQVLDMSNLMSVCLSWLLLSRVRKFRRDLRFTLYILIISICQNIADFVLVKRRVREATLEACALQYIQWHCGQYSYHNICSIGHYLHTPWCRVLLEKIIGLQLVKKFPAFHGTRRFITALTSVRHLSLSWASPIQSIYPYPTS